MGSGEVLAITMWLTLSPNHLASLIKSPWKDSLPWLFWTISCQFRMSALITCSLLAAPSKPLSERCCLCACVYVNASHQDSLTGGQLITWCFGSMSDCSSFQHPGVMYNLQTEFRRRMLLMPVSPATWFCGKRALVQILHYLLSLPKIDTQRCLCTKQHMSPQNKILLKITHKFKKADTSFRILSNPLQPKKYAIFVRSELMFE